MGKNQNSNMDINYVLKFGLMVYKVKYKTILYLSWREFKSCNDGNTILLIHDKCQTQTSEKWGIQPADQLLLNQLFHSTN